MQRRALFVVQHRWAGIATPAEARAALVALVREARTPDDPVSML